MKKLLLSICFLLTYLLLVCSFARAGENQDCLYWTDPVLGPQMHGVGCRELTRFKVEEGHVIIFSHPDSTTPSYAIAECNKSGRQCKVIDSSAFPCYKKLQNAVRRMKARMHSNLNSRSLTRGFVMTDEIWERELEATYQECVK